jgi:hypothetical protein
MAFGPGVAAEQPPSAPATGLLGAGESLVWSLSSRGARFASKRLRNGPKWAIMGSVGEARRENTDQTSFKRRFTVPEAAQVLGISPEAVRTRLSRGTLEGERNRGRVFVLLDADITDLTGSDAGITSEQTALIESLRDQVEYLRRELAVRTEENRRKDHLLAAALDRIPEIEAPNQEPPGAAEPATEMPMGPTASEASEAAQEGSERRSWWQRLFGG